MCYHKAFTFPPLDDGILLPIHVGKAISSQELNMQADNEVNGQPCDNISDKNESYCELTALYWAWKNLKLLYPDVKYVGLFHYRRFLDFHKKRFLVSSVVLPENELKNYRINPEEIISILEGGKIIVTNELTFPMSLRLQYCSGYVSEDYRTLKEIIKTQFHDYYDDFINVMERGNKFIRCNMFIMKYDDFMNYCEWIFAVLAELEKKVPWHYYSQSQKRLFGAIAERIFRVWLNKNGMKLKFCDLCVYNDEGYNKAEPELNIIKRIARYIRNNITAMLLNSGKSFD